MPTLTLISAGSRGDIQPFLVLGIALQRAGNTVNFAAPENERALIAEHGLAFQPLKVDFQALLDSQAGQGLKASGRNPIAMLREGQRVMKDASQQMVADVWEISAHTDALIGHIGLSACTHLVAQARQLPLVHVALQPFSPTTAFPNPLWPLRANLGGFYNRLTGQLVEQITWQAFGTAANAMSKQQHIQGTTQAQFFQSLRSTPILNAFSRHLIPMLTDWSPNNYISGFLHEPSIDAWQPPADLVTFLNAGKQPLYIGFGSAGNEAASLPIILDALQQTQQRAVITGIASASSTASAFIAPSVPFDWLFTRVSAAVHHGGAGTTAAALRAGLPMLTIPHVLDQFFWGERVHALCAGLPSIPIKKLTAPKLATAIQTLTTDATIRHQAEQLGAQMRVETGIENAVHFINTQIIAKPL